jgi:hypothetical protein
LLDFNWYHLNLGAPVVSVHTLFSLQRHASFKKFERSNIT